MENRIVLWSILFFVLLCLAGGALYGGFIIPIQYYIDIGNDVDTECAVLNIEDCSTCKRASDKYIEFEVKLDIDNITVTNLFKCDRYHLIEDKQVCCVDSIKLEVNSKYTCRYDDNSEQVYFEARILSTIGYSILFFCGIIILGILSSGLIIVSIYLHSTINEHKKKNNDNIATVSSTSESSEV